MKRFLCASLLLTSVLTVSSCSLNNDIRIGTGDVGGKYYSYGTALSQVIEESTDGKLTFKVRETAGSAGNMRLMKDDYIQLAFTQSDVLLDSYNGTGSFAEPFKDCAAIAGLYTEACQIVVAQDSDIETVSDLYGKRVSLGETESGVVQNAKQILSAYGLSEDMLDAQYLSFTDSAAALQNGDIDAFFCTAGTPTSAVAELARSGAIRILPVNGTEAERLIEQYPAYTPYVIEAGTYKNQTEDIETLGVKTLLVARGDLSDSDAEAITAAIFENSDELTYAIEGDSTFTPESATENIPIPFHDGAAQYYSSVGIDVTSQTDAEQEVK